MKPLLTVAEIRRLPLDRNRRGVYFLIKDAEIIYIGYSKDVRCRTRIHGKKFSFDECRMLECAPRDGKKLETRYLMKFSPRMNKMRSSCRDTSNKIRRQLGEKIPIEKGRVMFSTRLDPDLKRFYQKRHDLLNEVLRAYMEAHR